MKFEGQPLYSVSNLSMNTKTNLVNEEHQAFIAECIKRQNKNRFTTVKTVVFQAVSLLAVLAVCILILGAAFHFANFNKTKQQLETENLIRQLESGESVEMTVRVGGAE